MDSKKRLLVNDVLRVVIPGGFCWAATGNPIPAGSDEQDTCGQDKQGYDLFYALAMASFFSDHLSFADIYFILRHGIFLLFK